MVFSVPGFIVPTRPERVEIIKRLANKPWYQQSSVIQQHKLQVLPDDYDGYLRDLANRPDGAFGGVDVLYINDVYFAPYSLVVTVFQVKNPKGNEYTYEYASWKMGPASGAKGIVRLVDKGVVKALVILRGEKFAIGSKVYDIIGGFAEGESIAGMDKRFIQELKEELGLDSDPQVIKIYDLGRIYPDAGMTNNHPQIFVADIPLTTEIGKIPNPDEWELSGIGPLVIDIKDLPTLVMKNDDAFFLSVVARMIYMGLLPIQILD